MPVLSEYARKKKIRYFLDGIPKEARVLEIGCGDRWVGDYLKSHGWTHYCGIDVCPPADIVGDIKRWRELGLKEGSFDVIIAFEVVEHVDCFQECYELLHPGGKLMLSTPVPSRDWVLRIVETLGLTQRRTSPHNHLIDVREVPLFESENVRIIAGLAQWAILTKKPI